MVKKSISKLFDSTELNNLDQIIGGADNYSSSEVITNNYTTASTDTNMSIGNDVNVGTTNQSGTGSTQNDPVRTNWFGNRDTPAG